MNYAEEILKYHNIPDGDVIIAAQQALRDNPCWSYVYQKAFKASLRLETIALERHEENNNNGHKEMLLADLSAQLAEYALIQLEKENEEF